MKTQTKPTIQMKKRTMKIAGYAFSMVLLALSVLSVVSLFSPETAEMLQGLIGLGGSGGYLIANTPIVGTQTYEETNTNSPGHLKRDVSKIVTEMRPDEFPLDTMLREIRAAEKATNVKVEFETVKYRERESATTALFTAAGDATDESVELTISNINIWGVDDTVYIPSINGANSKPLRLLVMAVNRGTSKITVTAINSPTADTQRVPTIANATKIFRMGTAKEEKAATTDIIAQEPTFEYNYCQIQMAFLEQSVLRSLMESESGYSHKDKFVQEIYNMRSSCEATNLYGTRGRTINKLTGLAQYSADGIFNKVTNGTTYVGNDTTGDVITNKDVTAMLEKVFAGNAGSDERLLLAGSTMIKHLQDVGLEKQIGPTQITAKHGVEVLELESNFGKLMIKHSKMMDLFGDKEVAYILDLKHIFKHDLEPMGKKKLDPDAAGLRRVKDAVRILENSCLSVRYPDVHWKWSRDAGNSN